MTLIIGSGRAATHFKTYFNLLHIPFLEWNRRQHSIADLKNLMGRCQQVFVLISDSSLKSFIDENLQDFSGPVLHASGALEIANAISLHPLMTFGPELYPLSFYRAIPFVLTDGHHLQDYFPELENPSYTITAADKSRYHALCVMSGNFTTLLWQEAFKGFESLGLPRKIAYPYLQAIAQNLSSSASSQALTGPLARKDGLTIDKNLSSLQGSPLQLIYRAFVNVYFPEHPL